MARRPTNPFAPSRRETGFKETKPRNRANEDLIVQAIRQKVKIAFRYKPTDTTERVIEPYVIWLAEKENACLFGVQVISERGVPESDPKHVDPYQMTNIRLTGETFTVDPVFKRDRYPDHICMVSR